MFKIVSQPKRPQSTRITVGIFIVFEVNEELLNQLKIDVDQTP